MQRRHRRLTFALASLGLAAIALALALWALQNTVTYYYSPSELAAMVEKPTGTFRVGGLVVPGSVSDDDLKSMRFRVADGQKELAVTYSGPLPDLFREGQGVIAEGRMEPEGTFRAANILAKHDETYMPPQMVKMLKQKREWRGN